MQFYDVDMFIIIRIIINNNIINIGSTSTHR